VGPKGVSSGVSFRKLPNSSLQEIANICNHYEAKCTGKYSSLASRYVMQMGKEIREQVTVLEEMESRELDKTSARELHEALQDWKNNFRENDEHTFPSRERMNYASNNQGTINPKFNRCNSENGNINKENAFISPVEIKEEMNRLRNEVLELRRRLAYTQENSEKTKRILETEFNNHAEAFRRSAALDRDKQRNKLVEMERKYEVQVEAAQEEILQAKNDAENVINSIRENAEKSISEVIADIDGDKKRNYEDILEQRKKMDEEYEIKLRELDYKIKNQDKLRSEAVMKECQRLKHEHVIELAVVRRDGILKGCKAVLGDRSSLSSKRERMTGHCHSCGNIYERNDFDDAEESDLRHNKCECGVKNYKKIVGSNYCEVRLSGKDEECKRLKRRVVHLEDMVQTLIESIKGREKRKWVS